MVEQILTQVIATGPVAAVLFMMWHLERRDRIEKDRKAEVLHERTLTGLHDAVTAVRDLTEAVQKAVVK